MPIFKVWLIPIPCVVYGNPVSGSATASSFCFVRKERFTARASGRRVESLGAGNQTRDTLITSSLLRSVVTPYSVPVVADFIEIERSVRPITRTLLERYIPGIGSLPLNQGFEFVPTWKAVPNGRVFREEVRRKVAKTASYYKELLKPSSFSCLAMEWQAFGAYHILGGHHTGVPPTSPTNLWCALSILR
jgi:hypothetical protein